MPSLESREFWVIFDTSTRPEYYRDVHNLLALPKGAVMRYEYRDKYLSERALRLAVDTAAAPTKVLLIYGQKPGFHRGDDNAKAKAPAKELEWVCTRFGTMREIPATNGANFFFDFSVEGYPKLDQVALQKILAPLIEQSETPWDKWVAVSDDLSAYNDLNRGDEEKNWEAIVDRISGTQMQFHDDSFWRLKPTSSAAQAKLVTEVETIGDTRQVRQVSSRYELFPDDVSTFEAFSYSPAGRPSTQPSRVLKVQLDAGGPLVLDGPSSVDLRQYTAKTLKLRAKRSDDEDIATWPVQFKTLSDQTAWPDGPSIELVFQVSQHRPAVIPPLTDSKRPQTAAQAPVVKAGAKPGPAARTADLQPPTAKPQSPGWAADKPTPWNVLQAAIKAVPAVRFALGVVGLTATAAIGASFFQSFASAVVGTVVVFVLAVLLFLFSRVTQAAKGLVMWPAMVLTWSLTLIFVISLGLTVSTVFFAYPMPYPSLVHQFQPTRRASITAVVKDKSTDSPIAGAVITLQTPDGPRKGFTDAEGKAVVAGVAIGEGSVAGTVSAAGYQDSTTGFDPSDPAKSYIVLLNLLTEAPFSPPRPLEKRQRPTARTKISTAAEEQSPTAPAKVSAAANMSGTWQILVSGDINNVRVRDGTFLFQAQGNGEILASANFVLDDIKVRLTGTATAVGSQVFLKFEANNDAGGGWSGRGNFSLETSARMSGRIQPKSGGDVPLTLKKIPQ